MTANDPKALIEYPSYMQDVYKNIEENNISKRKMLIVLATECFVRDRKVRTSIFFITKSFFKMPKDFRLDPDYFFIVKIPNKRDPQQIALNHSSDIDFEDFIKICFRRDSTSECG